MESRVDLRLFSIGMTGLAAGKDLSNPAMTTYPNPLAKETAEDTRRTMIEDRNMHRLACDAKKRACPVNGNVYAGIMDTRYKGGD